MSPCPWPGNTHTHTPPLPDCPSTMHYACIARSGRYLWTVTKQGGLLLLHRLVSLWRAGQFSMPIIPSHIPPPRPHPPRFLWSLHAFKATVTQCRCLNFCLRLVSLYPFFFFFFTLLSQWEFFPLGIQVAFPPRKASGNRVALPNPTKCMLGLFRVSVIHRTLTWTAGSLTCVRDHSYACIMYTRGVGTLTATQQNNF